MSTVERYLSGLFSFPVLNTEARIDLLHLDTSHKHGLSSVHQRCAVLSYPAWYLTSSTAACYLYVYTLVRGLTLYSLEVFQSCSLTASHKGLK
jgi:hypothetical protein